MSERKENKVDKKKTKIAQKIDESVNKIVQEKGDRD